MTAMPKLAIEDEAFELAQRGDIDFVPCPDSTNICSSKCSEKPALESHGFK